LAQKVGEAVPMHATSEDWADTDGARSADDAFVLRLDSYEGPIDLLLDQARAQRVDLAQISILALADQYLAFMERARRLSIELAAQYLVMAAWLAYLKSRLLLPVPPPEDEPSAAQLADALAFQLRRLDAVRAVAGRLMARPQRGRDLFARGAAAEEEPAAAPVWTVTLHDLLAAYAACRRAANEAQGGLRIEASPLMSTEEAMRRLTGLLGRIDGWTALAVLLPPSDPDPLVTRSVLASTFSATLELARDGRLRLRQDGAFGPIWLRAATAA
jgi:segregation and condensation protein A